MGKIQMEDDRGKERLKSIKKCDKHSCCNCNNQTFILHIVSDFPYFECVCSKCGSLYIK